MNECSLINRVTSDILKKTHEFNHFPWIQIGTNPNSIFNLLSKRGNSIKVKANQKQPLIMGESLKPYFEYLEHNYLQQTGQINQEAYNEFKTPRRRPLNKKQLAKRASSIRKLRKLAEKSKAISDVYLSKMGKPDGIHATTNNGAQAKKMRANSGSETFLKRKMVNQGKIFKPKDKVQKMSAKIGPSQIKPGSLIQETRQILNKGSGGEEMSNLRIIQESLASSVREDLRAINRILLEGPEEELPHVERLIQTSFVLSKSIEEILQEIKKK